MLNNGEDNNENLFAQFLESNQRNANNVTQKDEVGKKNNVEFSENITQRNTADVTNNLLNELNKIQNEPENFNNTSKKRPLFISKRNGRPRNGTEKNIKDHEGKYRNINARHKIITKIKENIYKIAKKNFKGLEKLHELTIPKRFKNSIKKNNNFRKLSLYKLFCQTVPKNFKGAKDIEEKNPELKEKLRKEKYNTLEINNKKIIDNLIANDKRAEKFFKGLYVKDFEEAYFGRKNKIIKQHHHYGYIEVNLDGIETYSQNFNHEYDQNKKNNFEQKYFKGLDK